MRSLLAGLTLQRVRFGSRWMFVSPPASRRWWRAPRRLEVADPGLFVLAPAWWDFYLLCARFGWVWRFTLSAFLACFLSAAFGNIDYTQKSCACCQFGNIFSDTENAYTARVSDNPSRRNRRLRVWFIVSETQKSAKKRTKRAVRKPIHRKGFRQYYDVSEQFFQKKNISEIAVSLVPQGFQAIG